MATSGVHVVMHFAVDTVYEHASSDAAADDERDGHAAGREFPRLLDHACTLMRAYGAQVGRVQTVARCRQEAAAVVPQLAPMHKERAVLAALCAYITLRRMGVSPIPPILCEIACVRVACVMKAYTKALSTVLEDVRPICFADMLLDFVHYQPVLLPRCAVRAAWVAARKLQTTEPLSPTRNPCTVVPACILFGATVARCQPTSMPKLLTRLVATFGISLKTVRVMYMSLVDNGARYLEHSAAKPTYPMASYMPRREAPFALLPDGPCTCPSYRM